MARKLFDLDTDKHFTLGMQVEFIRLQREMAEDDLELAEICGCVVHALGVLDKAIGRRMRDIRTEYSKRADTRKRNSLTRKAGK